MGRKRHVLEDVGEHFEALVDPRSSVNQRHPLLNVIVISLCAVLAGAEGPSSIRAWAEEKSDWLHDQLSMPFGIPSRDVFRRVLMAMNPEAFQNCFVRWMETLKLAAKSASESEDKAALNVLAIDGKTLRRSHDRNKGLGPLHLVSVWASEYGLTLAQTATEEKSNETTAIPEVLKLVDVSKAIVTIDAMGAQRKIAKQIVEGGGDYLFTLKGNQDSLHKAVAEHIERHLANDFESVPARRLVTEETAHGRHETRMYIQLSVPKDLPGRDRWSNLRTIGVVIRKTVRGGEESTQLRYYISSLRLGVKRFARAIRSHWSIENTCYWSLDVIYREDASRVRQRTVAENLAWLRRFTLGLIKQYPGKDSLVMRRRRCGWNDQFLMQVLTYSST